MANVYWNKESAVDAHWDTHDDNWWNNVLHRDGTDENGAVPVDTNFAYLLGTTAPDSGPAVAVSLIGLDTSALTAAVTITSGVTVTDTLVMGVRGGTDVHTFSGDASTATRVLARGGAVIGDGGNIPPGAMFFDTASWAGDTKTIGGGLRLHDSASVTAGEVTGTAYVYGDTITCYVDGVVNSTGAITNAMIVEATPLFPQGEYLNPIISVKELAAEANTLTVDWIRCAQMPW